MLEEVEQTPPLTTRALDVSVRPRVEGARPTDAVINTLWPSSSFIGASFFGMKAAHDAYNKAGMVLENSLTVFTSAAQLREYYNSGTLHPANAAYALKEMALSGMETSGIRVGSVEPVVTGANTMLVPPAHVPLVAVGDIENIDEILQQVNDFETKMNRTKSGASPLPPVEEQWTKSSGKKHREKLRETIVTAKNIPPSPAKPPVAPSPAKRTSVPAPSATPERKVVSSSVNPPGAPKKAVLPPAPTQSVAPAQSKKTAHIPPATPAKGAAPVPAKRPSAPPTVSKKAAPSKVELPRLLAAPSQKAAPPSEQVIRVLGMPLKTSDTDVKLAKIVSECLVDLEVLLHKTMETKDLFEQFRSLRISDIRAFVREMPIKYREILTERASRIPMEGFDDPTIPISAATYLCLSVYSMDARENTSSFRDLFIDILKNRGVYGKMVRFAFTLIVSSKGDSLSNLVPVFMTVDTSSGGWQIALNACIFGIRHEATIASELGEYISAFVLEIPKTMPDIWNGLDHRVAVRIRTSAHGDAKLKEYDASSLKARAVNAFLRISLLARGKSIGDTWVPRVSAVDNFIYDSTKRPGVLTAPLSAQNFRDKSFNAIIGTSVRVVSNKSSSHAATAEAVFGRSASVYDKIV
jgi:hypothetical protein